MGIRSEYESKTYYAYLSQISEVVIEGALAICPACKQKRKLGSGSTIGGIKNILRRHVGSKECIDAKTRQDRSAKLTQSSLLSFTKPKPIFIPSTVSAPHPIIQSTSLQSRTDTSDTVEQPQTIPSSMSCPEFLLEIKKLVQLLPDTVLDGLESDILAIYSGDPEAMVGSDLKSSDDIWEQVVSRKLHQVFLGKTEEEIVAVIRRGPFGVDGFITFATYFTQVRELNEAYFHEQTKALTKAIQQMYVFYFCPLPLLTWFSTVWESDLVIQSR